MAGLRYEDRPFFHIVNIKLSQLPPKQLSKPSPLFFWLQLLALLLHSGLACDKLLLDRSRMESLGRCRCLLGGKQRRTDLRQPCVQFFTTPASCDCSGTAPLERSVCVSVCAPMERSSFKKSCFIRVSACSDRYKTPCSVCAYGAQTVCSLPLYRL